MFATVGRSTPTPRKTVNPLTFNKFYLRTFFNMVSYICTEDVIEIFNFMPYKGEEKVG